MYGNNTEMTEDDTTLHDDDEEDDELTQNSVAIPMPVYTPLCSSLTYFPSDH